jgi:hypothetical protein
MGHAHVFPDEVEDRRRRSAASIEVRLEQRAADEPLVVNDLEHHEQPKERGDERYRTVPHRDAGFGPMP